MILHRFNQQGIDDFSAFLDNLTQDPEMVPPVAILEDQRTAEALKKCVYVERRTFTTRFDAAAYLHDQFVAAGLSDSDLDPGVWAWLALFFFNELRPPAGRNVHGWPGERARWIPTVSDHRKQYRHLLAGPWRVYRFHHDNPERARVLLCGPLHSPGEASAQMLSRQELVTNRGVVELATRLYYDAVQGKLKRGAAAKRPGAIRRYAEILNQLDVTWDLHSMNADDIAELLPMEFSHFLPAHP